MPPPLPELRPDEPPANEASAKVVALVERIRRTAAHTRYQAQTVVDDQRGVFYWDCSGMATWILRRTAPVARSAITRQRPVARDYFRIMSVSPTDSSRYGWQRIAHPAALRPGDLFAWLKPPSWKRANTGHVGFVTTTAARHPWFEDVWLMRVVDSTRVYHGEDTRAGEQGGFGEGTIAFRVDDRGHPSAYGWYGARQPPRSFVPTRIVFGRVTR